jgi:hypothetical protein
VYSITVSSVSCKGTGPAQTVQCLTTDWNIGIQFKVLSFWLKLKWYIDRINNICSYIRAAWRQKGPSCGSGSRYFPRFQHQRTSTYEPGSSGSIVSDYGLDDRTIGVRSPAGAEDFSSILCVQTGSGAHPASCTMGTWGPFSGGKVRLGRDADHSPPSSAEVVNE